MGIKSLIKCGIINLMKEMVFIKVIDEVDKNKIISNRNVVINWVFCFNVLVIDLLRFKIVNWCVRSCEISKFKIMIGVIMISIF